MQFYINCWRLIKSSKSVICQYSGRNSIWRFLMDNAGVSGVFRTLPKICDEASLRKCWRLKTVDCFWKKLRHRYLTESSIRLLDYTYFHSLFVLGIILNLEFHILGKLNVYGYPKTYLGAYQTSMMEIFSNIWANVNKLVPKISKIFIRFTWQSAHLKITLKMLNANPELFSFSYDCNVFYNTDPSCFLIHWLV